VFSLTEARETKPALWVICGAGRGVGKSILALNLCRALPDAVYAKQGTSRRSAGKPENYFHGDDELTTFLRAQTRAGRRHLLVESNAMARRGFGDIIIFLEMPGGRSLRGEPRSDTDELRAKAHVRLGGGPEGAAQERDVETSDGGSHADSPADWLGELRSRIARLGLDPDALTAVVKIIEAQDAWNRGKARS
jgi:hypothetical protein